MGGSIPIPFAIGEKGPQYAGMALRDWFASQVASALIPIAHRARYCDAPEFWDAGMPWWEEVAEGAYCLADAMLKAREEGVTP